MPSLPPPRHQTRPIGNAYLQVRAEVGTALFALSALAADTGATPATLHRIQGLQTGLREPLLFMVFGEPGAGKSSLLNALFGREFCQTDSHLPATDSVHVFKYGEPAREVVLSPALVEHYQPTPFLRDFHVVDTPGTNAPDTEAHEISEAFLTQADVVLLVISAANPWAHGAWELFDRLQQSGSNKVVLILQQADLREPREVETILQHLCQTAHQRGGQTFPVFAVSAKKALLAKTSGLDKERLWAESRFGDLETHVNGALGAPGESARMSKLRSVTNTARLMLKELATDSHHAETVTVGDRERFNRLRESMAAWKKGSQAQVQSLLSGFEGAFDRCRGQGEHALALRLRFWPVVRLALAGRDRGWEAAFQRDEETRLRAALSPKIERALGALEDNFLQTEAQMKTSLRAGFSPESRTHLAPEPPGGAAERRKRTLESIELAMAERLADDGGERQLGSGLARLGAGARLPAGAAVAAGLASVGEVYQRGLLLGALAAGAAVLTAGGAIRTGGQRQRVLAIYRGRWDGKGQELSNAVGDLVLQAIDDFYRGQSRRLAPLEAFISEQETHLRPLRERVTTLERQFIKVAARL